MEDPNQAPTAPCYAEMNVVKRLVSPALAAAGVPSFSGRIYATTIYNSAVGQTQQNQYPGTNNAVPNGGSVAEITIDNSGVLVGRFNNATVLTLSGVKCKNVGNYYVPNGFIRVDRGFEGNSTGSVWTNGASIGQVQQKFGVNGTYTSSPQIPSTNATYPTWSTSYNPNDNLGTIIMFR